MFTARRTTARTFDLRRGVLALLLALPLVLGTPQGAHGQAPRVLSSLGYGALGTGVGLALTAGADCTGGGFVCIPAELVVGTLGGALVGLIVGNHVAASANRDLAEGRPVGDGHLSALAMGTVLGGAALGVAMAGMLVNGGGEGTPLGSDESTFAILGLAGAGYGVYRARKAWGALTANEVEFSPAVGLDGRVGVRVSMRF